MVGTVIASSNGAVGIEQAVEVLRSGGSAVDAVIAGIKLVEANPDDHTVGYSGLPNLLGEVELDASIMDGDGLRAGSIGALHNYQDAIQLAHHVMIDLPHVLIVGNGAEQLAEEVGLAKTDLLTPEAERIWRERVDANTGFTGGQLAYYTQMRELAKRLTIDPEKPKDHHGTVNFIARDETGRIACGVSTSGWAWKYPGRLGDSPIIGAGNYADSRWGAAACTGRGEMAQRCCTAHSVVTFLRFGLDIEEAVQTAMTDLRALNDPYASEMNIIAMDRNGNIAAASTAPEKTYVAMTVEMSTFAENKRRYIPL